MSLLVGGTGITLELVVTAEGLGLAKVAKAAGDGGVLLHVDAQIQKVFVLAGHCFTIETSGLTGEDALEQIVDPGAVGLSRS